MELGTLPKIYPITDTRLTSLSHAEQVEKLSDGGTRFIQLREKYASPRDFYEDAKSAIEIARRNGVKIIINDRVDIALALKADGVHLGQDDLPPAKARQILGEKAIIGFSTQTKENPDETVGLEGVKTVREAIGDFPLVAIGGITPENFQAVFEAGADSLAIIKAVLFPPHKIEENLHSFLSTLP